jgi:hypothetical protein
MTCFVVGKWNIIILWLIGAWRSCTWGGKIGHGCAKAIDTSTISQTFMCMFYGFNKLQNTIIMVDDLSIN